MCLDYVTLKTDENNLYLTECSKILIWYHFYIPNIKITNKIINFISLRSKSNYRA